VDPEQPKRVLGLPEPRVLAAVKETWREDRKPANVLLVLDTSGSMNDEGRLQNAKEGLQTFLKEVAPQDRVGLTIFNDRVTEVAPITPVRRIRASLRGVVSRLIADGGTAIYDATAAGVATVKQLDAQGDSSRRVRVFTIAYSAGASGAAEKLERIAEASGGKAYKGSTDDIESVYRSISSFF